MEQCRTYDSTGLESSTTNGDDLPTKDQTEEEILATKKIDSIINRTLPLSENATNSHPLMSPGSTMSPGFPDLIPEKAKSRFHEKFHPLAHSTLMNSADSIEWPLNLPVLEYDESSLPENLDVLSQNKANSKRRLIRVVPLVEKQSESSLESASKDNLIVDESFDINDSDFTKSLPHDWRIESYDPTSDAENENSVYEAHLSSNLQNVTLTMNEKEGNLNFLSHNKGSNKLRRIRIDPDVAIERSDSSIDSDSELSLKSDIFDEEGQRKGDRVDNYEENNSSEPIEPLSAAEERKHAKNWQRMVLPGGEHRTIDMRVIEPYKRVLSHGGYLRAGGHTAIVLFAACYLPDKSRVDYDYVMDNLFLYVLWTLERLVTDDYVMVYLHGAATKLPSFSWLKRCYQMVGRKLRKNLSHLYVVHPTLWIKTMLYMAKPFISSKFYRKITFIGSLRDLLSRIPLEAAAIPDKVRAYDTLHGTA